MLALDSGDRMVGCVQRLRWAGSIGEKRHQNEKTWPASSNEEQLQLCLSSHAGNLSYGTQRHGSRTQSLRPGNQKEWHGMLERVP